MKLYIYIYIDIYFYTYMTEALGTLSKLIAAYRVFKKIRACPSLIYDQNFIKKETKKEREHV